jgi:hypothetical protein
MYEENFLFFFIDAANPAFYRYDEIAVFHYGLSDLAGYSAHNFCDCLSLPQLENKSKNKYASNMPPTRT